MKLIIDIPDNAYKHIKEYYEKNDIVEATYSYVYHGIPLDKIRAEINDIEEGISSYHNDRPWLFKDEVLQIIDKYTKEDTDYYDYLAEEDDWRDRLDELEREEYYESKYGKEQE